MKKLIINQRLANFRHCLMAFVAVLLLTASQLNAQPNNSAKGKDCIRYDFEHHYCIKSIFDHVATRTTPPMYDPATGVYIPREGIESNMLQVYPGFERSFYDYMTDLGENRIADMDAAGIDVAILSLSATLSELEEEYEIALASEANDSVAAVVNRHPDRFMGAMALPTASVEAAITEMNRCAGMYIEGTNEKVFKYWHLESNLGADNAPLWDSKYYPLYEEAERLGIAIYIHPNTPTATYLLDNGVNYAQPGLGYGQDVMKTVLMLADLGLFDRCPNLRMIVGHYGEYMPFVVERSDHLVWAMTPEVHFPIIAEHPIAYYVRHRNIMISSSGNMDPRVYNCSKQVFGHTCLVFGSDYPYENIKNAVDAIDIMNLPEQENNDFWQNNAESYILNGTTSWGDDIPEPQYDLTLKNPTVTGYDFEHHSYISPLIDTLAARTTVPRIDVTNDVFYFHEQIFIRQYNFLIGPILADFGQNRMDALNSASPNLTAVVSTSEAIADLPEEQAIPLARMTNDSIYALGQRFPGRFRGEMCLPWMNVDSALVEMHRCARLGFRVWCIPSYGGTNEENAYFIYEPKYEPLLAEAEKLGISIYLHPQVTVDSDIQSMGYAFGSASYGFAAENMRTATRLILNGTFDRYPRLRLIVAHMGEYFPFVMERMDNRFAAIPDDPYVKNQHPVSWYFENRNVLVSTSGLVSKAAFDLTKEVVGVDGILFSSDYPYEDYKTMADFVRSMDVTQEELDKIWGLNAEQYVYYDLPAALTAKNITTTSADLSWIGEIDNRFIIEVTDPEGVTNVLETEENPYTVTGLTPLTEYSIRLRGINAAGDTTEYTNTIVVKTLAEGIGENSAASAEIYPNPTRGDIKVECAGMQRIVIMSVTGSVVYDNSVTGESKTIDMSRFSGGAYIINIYTKNGNVTKLISVTK